MIMKIFFFDSDPDKRDKYLHEILLKKQEMNF